ncbi:hypothetical protein B0H16DRAFT_967780 [Mycena metata]|uniref:Uncharacterized protein n=1 Tax=Mycena metata TaxID=1033252 RepID=A0AAD7ILT4_9AGAR|nr:hypothetical protein B0H16DRAFT_967780 [Mycena metata]
METAQIVPTLGHLGSGSGSGSNLASQARTPNLNSAFGSAIARTLNLNAVFSSVQFRFEPISEPDPASTIPYSVGMAVPVTVSISAFPSVTTEEPPRKKYARKNKPICGCPSPIVLPASLPPVSRPCYAYQHQHARASAGGVPRGSSSALCLTSSVTVTVETEPRLRHHHQGKRSYRSLPLAHPAT